MSLKEFKNEYLELSLGFLWRQWSALGVMGEATIQDAWAIDPEALLVFSLQVARYEPRLFDEILSWLVINGDCLDSARLKRFTIATDPRVIGAVVQHLSTQATPRKWRNFVAMYTKEYNALPKTDSMESFFKDQSGGSYPLTPPPQADPSFALFFFNRSLCNTSKNARTVPVNASTNIRFLLRALFGVGARAETVLYLLTHEGGRPQDIAESTGFFRLSVQTVLADLVKSRMVQTRSIGKRIEYLLNYDRWWRFISNASVNEAAVPRWLNWQAIFTAMAHLLQTLETISSNDLSEYMTASKMQDSMDCLHREFIKGGYAIPPPPQAGLPADLYEKSTVGFLRSIFATNTMNTGA